MLCNGMLLNGSRKQNLNLCENRNDLQHVQDTFKFYKLSPIKLHLLLNEFKLNYE